MALLQSLKSFVNERLSAAAEEIFVVVERIITDYEDQIDLHRSEVHSLLGVKGDNKSKKKGPGWAKGSKSKDEDFPFRSIAYQGESSSYPAEAMVSIGTGAVEMEDRAAVSHVAEFQHLPVCEDQVLPEELERTSSLAQEEPELPQIKEEQQELLQCPDLADESTLTLISVKREDDDENRETEPVAGTSTEHMKTQAGVENCGASQPTSDDQLLSSRCFASDTEDSDEWENREDQSALNTLKSHETQNVEGQQLSLSNNLWTGEKPFICTVCGKGFGHKGNLKSHMRIHTGEKPFTCTVCDKSFCHMGDLKRHARSHTGEKPFACIFCNKGFSHSGDLKKHMMIHTGEKPFTCTICQRSFSRNYHLKTHMRGHTGEKKQ